MDIFPSNLDFSAPVYFNLSVYAWMSEKPLKLLCLLTMFCPIVCDLFTHLCPLNGGEGGTP